MSRPAESPGGLRKTLPADGRPSGWCSWRQWRISSSRALIVSGIRRVEPEGGLDDQLGGTVRRRMLETAVAVGQAELGGGDDRLGPVASRGSGPIRRTAATSAPWAPAFAQTAPPTVPGMASPNSSPDRPACWVSVAARAIGTPASAT